MTDLAAVLVPALSAVVGSVLTIVGNGLAGKWSDDRKLEQERLRAQDQLGHQARILRAVLRSELAAMARMFTSEQKFADDRANGYTIVPIAGYLKTLQKDISAIGLLHSSEAEAVMEALYVYQERVWYIRNNGAKTTGGAVTPADEPVNYDLSVDPFRDYLVNDLRQMVKAIRKALEALDGRPEIAAAPQSDLLRKLVQGSPSR